MIGVKTASEVTYTVSGGALNSAQSSPIQPLTYTSAVLHSSLFTSLSSFTHSLIWGFFELHTWGLRGAEVPQWGSSLCGKDPVEGAGDLLHNKNRICDVKVYINVNFYISFVRTHNTVSHAKIAQSTEP